MHQIQLFSADSLATTLLEYLKTFGDRNLSLAIPGGRSPGKVLQPLAQACSENIRERLHLFWVDERSVEIGHSDRNDQPTLQAWRDGGQNPHGVHPMPAEMSDQADACQQYAQKIVDLGFENGMDISLLGIGEDGHFASCFPNHDGLNNSDIVFAISDSPKPPPSRLSLSLPYILKSKRIDVLVFGADKGLILKKAHGQTNNPEVPVSLLADHSNIHYHLDPSAMETYQN